MNLRQRQALRLITDNRDGVTTPLLMAHGCNTDTLSTLIRAGFVTKTVEKAKAGDKVIEVTRVKITEAGRRALGTN